MEAFDDAHGKQRFCIWCSEGTWTEGRLRREGRGAWIEHEKCWKDWGATRAGATKVGGRAQEGEGLRYEKAARPSALAIRVVELSDSNSEPSTDSESDTSVKPNGLSKPRLKVFQAIISGNAINAPNMTPEDGAEINIKIGHRSFDRIEGPNSNGAQEPALYSSVLTCGTSKFFRESIDAHR